MSRFGATSDCLQSRCRKSILTSPPICVEVKLPSKTPMKRTLKVREYFKSGVRLVWVVDPEERTVTVYRKPGRGEVFWEDDTITGEDVLPGFSCPVAEFFQ